jgi:CheY-specific phosphatase CheX
MEALSNTRLIAVVSKGDVAAVDQNLFDRVAVRSFVPETFLKQFENFLKAPGVLAKVSAAIPGFRSQTISAVEQVFGMMIGTEVNILTEPPPMVADGVNVGIPLSLADQNTEVMVTASISEHAGRELAARMMQSPVADLPEDAASSALSEILNMVGGRVQHGLNGNGLQAQIGLPLAIQATEPKGESIVLGFGFESMSGEMQTFSFSVREQEASKGAKTQ